MCMGKKDVKKVVKQFMAAVAVCPFCGTVHFYSTVNENKKVCEHFAKHEKGHFLFQNEEVTR